MDKLKNEEDNTEIMPPIFEVNIKEEWEDSKTEEIKQESQEHENLCQYASQDCSNLDQGVCSLNSVSLPVTYSTNTSGETFITVQNSIEEKNETKTEMKPDDTCVYQLTSMQEVSMHPSCSYVEDNIALIQGTDSVYSINKETENYICKDGDNTCSPTSTLQTDTSYTHVENKGHQCSECHRIYSSSSILHEHIKNVHEGIRYECHECKKEFTLQRNLKKHVDAVHLKIKNAHCSQCNKMFSDMAHLKKHIELVHLKLKNFKCDVCPKVFTQKVHLKKHFNTVHKGVKNFECHVCHKCFTQRANLQRHYNSVHKCIKQECPRCKKWFADVKKHNIRFHEKNRKRVHKLFGI